MDGRGRREMSTPRSRAEWLDLLHRCQDGYASCAFVASAIEDEMDNLTAAGIHSCHDQCARPMCVLRRERNAAVIEAKRWESLCETAWRRHDEVSASLFHANLELGRHAVAAARETISRDPSASGDVSRDSTQSP